MNSERDAIRVVVTRNVIESEHLVDAVIADRNGAVEVYGRRNAMMIPRSAIKPIQAIPLVRSGAADAFDVSPVELAVAGSSHSAEPGHVSAVAAWLNRIGLDPGALACGSDRPIDQAAADQLVADAVPFAPIHNPCSGKHTGFLTICRHLGMETTGYIDRDHPVQHLVAEAIGEFCGTDLATVGGGIDGCGIPTFPFPVAVLAQAMVHLVRPDRLDDETAAAAARISHAYAEHPWWVSGTGRHEVTLAGLAREPLVVKSGAEGVFMGALPDRGLGFALKARDGAGRAAQVAIAALLEQLEVIPSEVVRFAVTNKAGTVVGEMTGLLR